MADETLEAEIQSTKERIEVLQWQLRLAERELFELELELINKTPTAKMKAAIPNEAYLSVSDNDIIDDLEIDVEVDYSDIGTPPASP